MDQITPKQMALGIGVSEATIKRWCDQGKLETLRTEGGHRRIPMHAVLTFLKSSGRQLVKPEVFRLPTHTGKTNASLSRIRTDMLEILKQGDLEGLRRIMYNLLLSNRSLVEICDEVLSPAFTTLGQMWHDHEIAIYQERRACQICTQMIYELHHSLPQITANAPIAVGGTLSHDHYELATLMIELCLREAGWRSTNLGTNLPVKTYTQAISDLKPRLIWLSVTHLNNEGDFLKDFHTLYEHSQKSQTPIAVGGQGLTKELRAKMQYSTYCDQIHHLIDFANIIKNPNH